MARFLTFYLIVTLLLAGSVSLNAQNLVRNPSFEELGERVFCGPVRTRQQFDASFASWTMPTLTSPDVFSDQVQSGCYSNIYKQSILPRSGRNMVGIATACRTDNCPQWHEYIQGELKEALIPGESYYVSFWVARSSQYAASNNLGVYFSDSLIRVRACDLVGLKPEILDDQLIKKTNEWTRVKGTFIASTASQYVIIGNFYTNENTMIYRPARCFPDAYYYLDDVLVKHLGPDESLDNIAEEQNAFGLRRMNLDHFDDVLFETGKSQIQDRYLKRLGKLADYLEQHQHYVIDLIGHTDNQGILELNHSLSWDRAKAVKGFLLNRGISKDRINIKGEAYRKPKADNDTSEGRQINRRVEIQVRL